MVLAGLLASVSLVGAACGVGSSGERDTSDALVVGEPTILFAGDSVMEELAAGLSAALDGVADTSYIGVSTIAGDPAAPTTWASLLEQEAPDLVVVMVGAWEVLSPPASSNHAISYQAAVAPFVEVLTASTEVLWLGYPSLQREYDVTIDELAVHWSQLAARHERVSFLDAGEAVEADGAFRTLLDVGGREVLVRQLDGRHLCQDGVVLMAWVVLDELEERFGVRPTPGWETGDWRQAPAFEEDRLCPAELGEPLLD